MHGIILLKLWALLDLAHVDDDRRSAAEDGIPGAFISFPGINEMVNALLEELAVNLDVRHLLRLTQRLMAKRKTDRWKELMMGVNEKKARKKKKRDGVERRLSIN